MCKRGERAVCEDRAVPGTNPGCEKFMVKALKIRDSTPFEPSILSVAGHALEMPTRECGLAVEQALREDRVIPSTSGECKDLIAQALEIQRSAPPPEKVNLGHPFPTPALPR